MSERSRMARAKRISSALHLPVMALATAFAFGPGTSTLAQQPAPAAIPVGTVAAEKRAITQSADFVGRIEAVNRVDVRARVTGYLEDVLFKDGATVTEGTPSSASSARRSKPPSSRRKARWSVPRAPCRTPACSASAPRICCAPMPARSRSATSASPRKRARRATRRPPPPI